jgi:glycosyltransferase involved in cell wall biosynthesis
MNRPLVSLTVICYQAEAFILEAINGALSQTYTPLEIIFSDDASNDKTFDIIKEAVAKYAGPHRIILNRNSSNLGIGAHVSKVWFDIAQGDWIIVSAGDDISEANRVARLMEVANPSIGAVHHNCIAVDDLSREIDFSPISSVRAFEECDMSLDDLILKGGSLLGSTMCINKKMLSKYGPINADVVNEDSVIMYRAKHFGGFLFLDEALLRYRIHIKSVSNQFYGSSIRNYASQIVTNCKNRLAIINQIFADGDIITLSNDTVRHLNKEKRRLEIDLFLFSNGKFNISYFSEIWFYIKLAKWIFFRPYRIIRNLKINRNHDSKKKAL